MLRMLNLSSAYKSSATEALLAERGRLDSSHDMIDATLECVFSRSLTSSFLLMIDNRQAHETRAEFARQRSLLGSIQTRVLSL
jgi:golgi SNAP receptor complex member 1